ncbi:hypothetical protein M5E89_10490 [Acidaminococcus intestini]|nr:hypothetical protein M5E89_10490 [Acidaminococcus intestini]
MVLYAKDRSLMASILIHLFCFGIFSVLSYQGLMTHVKGKGPIYMVGLSGGRKGGRLQRLPLSHEEPSAPAGKK